MAATGFITASLARRRGNIHSIHSGQAAEHGAKCDATVMNPHSTGSASARRTLTYRVSTRCTHPIGGTMPSLPSPERCQAIARRLACHDFPWDVARALEFALFRTFASPAIATVLHATGEFEKRAQRRYDDTDLIVATIIENGFDSDLGKRAIARMNAIHGRFRIANEDFLYVLSTFVLEPLRWLDRFGWRALTPEERLGWFGFWLEVGKRMQIRDLTNGLAGIRAIQPRLRSGRLWPDGGRARGRHGDAGDVCGLVSTPRASGRPRRRIRAPRCPPATRFRLPGVACNESTHTRRPAAESPCAAGLTQATSPADAHRHRPLQLSERLADRGARSAGDETVS